MAILALSVWGPRWIAQRREEARPLPAKAAANVLLVVLDTVGADHLSLHGYARPTSPTLEELASRAIRFDRAQAPSSWTLPSHASMFTGMWPHELSVGWLTPLDRASPTLAEYLGTRGYATAGFVANLSYCATDSGLGRGFATYQDYIFPRLTALKTATPCWMAHGGDSQYGGFPSAPAGFRSVPGRATKHLAALRGRPKRRGGDQSRASRLALPAHGSRTDHSSHS